MAYTAFSTVTFGPSKAGLATVGYQLFNANNTANGSRITAGVSERSPGSYGALINYPTGFVGEVRWDTGEATPAYASAPVNPGDAENLDAAISSRNSVTPPTAVQIRQEMDANSTKLGADTAGVTTLLTRLPSVLTVTSGKVDVNDKTGFSLSPAGVQSIWDALTSNLTTNGSIGRLLANSSGTGAYTFTVTVTDGTSPLQGATVRLVQGINSFVATTNVSGVASFALGAATYSIAITKSGYQFAPSTVVVTGSGNANEVMVVATIIGAPADPAQITGYLVTRNGQGLIQPHATITFQLVTAPGTDSYKTAPFVVKSDATGSLQIALRLGSTYRAKRTGGEWVTVTVPSSGTTFSLPQLLGDA